MAVTKWSVSVEETLAARVEGRVGDRGLSGFVARAVEHELERDVLDEYLGELDAGDAHDPESLGRWWRDALGWVVVNEDPEEFEIDPALSGFPVFLRPSIQTQAEQESATPRLPAGQSRR